MAELNGAFGYLEFGNENVGDSRILRNDNNGVKPQIAAFARRNRFVLLIALGILLLVAVLVLQLVILNRPKGACEETGRRKAIKSATEAPVETNPSLTTKPVPGCVTPWIAFTNSCYLFGHEPMTFLLAVDYCQKKNAHLVHVEDHGENDFLRTYIIDKVKQSAWIGLTDLHTEGVYEWFGTARVVNFTDWVPGEPNNGRNDEHCVHFWTEQSTHWNDDECYDTHIPCCERPYLV